MSEVIQLSLETSTLIRILVMGFGCFVLSMLITPIYTQLAYNGKWWKQLRSDSWSGGKASVYKKLHAEKHKRNIPTMAGLIFVSSITLITIFFNLDRSQTWLPLAGMLFAGVIGLFDDWLNIRGDGTGVAGMRSKIKFALHSAVALAGGWWFWSKLDVSSVNVPFAGQVQLGFLVVILFWLVVVATANAVNISDGLDGLAGGLLSTSYAVYAIICIVEGKYILAAFCAAAVGALLSYTWFNIHPARFFMGDIGSFAMGTALGIIAMQTDTVFILPIIGIVYVAETGSVIINRSSKKLRNGKKVFLSSPIHHHFEAVGWPETKVTMRLWVLGQVAGVVGLVVYLLTRVS